MKRFKNVWKSKKQILEGIRNNIFKNETVEKIAEERFEEFCMKCDHRDDAGTSCVVPGTGPCCNLCGCTLKLATRSLSYTCKAGKWPVYMTEDENTELQIILNYVSHLDDLFDNKIINEETKNRLHSQLLGTSYEAVEARFEIRNNMEKLKK